MLLFKNKLNRFTQFHFFKGKAVRICFMSLCYGWFKCILWINTGQIHEEWHDWLIDCYVSTYFYMIDGLLRFHLIFMWLIDYYGMDYGYIYLYLVQYRYLFKSACHICGNLGRCRCGLGDYRQWNPDRDVFITNCTNTGFTDPEVLGMSAVFLAVFRIRICLERILIQTKIGIWTRIRVFIQHFTLPCLKF